LEGEAGRLAVANSIVAGNVSLSPDGERRASDITGTIAASNGHNLLGSAVTGAVAGDLEGVASSRLFTAIDPDTGGGLLALNGGPTPTVRLRDALDNPALSGADPLDAGAVDQRGVDRPLPPLSNPDIGSFELNQRSISTRPSDSNDVLTGTAGADILIALASNDLVRGLGGNDDLRGVGGGDTLQGGAGPDRLDGGSGSDLLLGEDGNDRLFGGFNADTLFGGAGGDVLRGQLGADLLRGDGGRDVFDLDPGDTSVGADRRDLILDFALDAGRIDLGSIDAKAGVAGDQAFAFVGTSALTGAGQLRYGFAGTSTVVQASIDADAAPELEVQLAGQIALRVGDFVL
jgi:Ca2+-binding RTX toxin-like protein